MRSEPERTRSLHAVRHQLAASDYNEVINFSFAEEAWEADFAGNAEPIRLLNPIASQLAVMRSSLIGGLVANVRHNLNRKISRIRGVRDRARVSARSRDKGRRPRRRGRAPADSNRRHRPWAGLGRAVGRARAWRRFFDIKGDLESLLAPRARASSLRCIQHCIRGALRA